VSTPQLAVLRALFDRLHAEDVRYCHWKSNEHLAASFAGATDVDVLFDRRAIIPLTRALGDIGFKRFVVKPGRGYPGIEDYVGFDRATGTLTHLHVHYQLTLGEKFLKGHRLPWEERYLSSRVWNREFEIYTADPHLELTALLVRAVMKLRWRDSFKETFGSPFITGGMRRELAWLRERVTDDRLVETARDLVGEPAARLLPALLAEGRPSVRRLRAFGTRINPALDEYRLYTSNAAGLHMLGRELSIVWWKLRNWYVGAPTQSTRTAPQGGLTVALLGPDGAGKSTVTGAIASWLAREVAVVTTYGGSGKGSAALPRRAMQTVAALWRRGSRSGQAAVPVVPSEGGHPSLARLAWILSLSRERLRRARAARRAKGLGMVVLSDRFPQSQFPGWNDGPRLTQWIEAGPWLVRRAARRERDAFIAVELSPPDLVIKLNITPEAALTRKPETPVDQVHRGVDLLRRLKFPPTTRVVDLNAEEPLEAVVLLAKQAVWDAL